MRLLTAKRPRTYADRKWIEGYEEVSREIHHRPFAQMHEGQAQLYVWIYRCREQYGILTAKQKGRVDAILDAFGF